MTIGFARSKKCVKWRREGGGLLVRLEGWNGKTELIIYGWDILHSMNYKEREVIIWVSLKFVRERERDHDTVCGGSPDLIKADLT
jgi:hypothetical protein